MKTTSLIAATVGRWTARILSALLIVVIVMIAVGERMPVGRILAHPFTFEALGGVGLFLILAGFLAGWRRELVGGMLSLVGVCSLLASMTITGNGRITWFFAALAAPGVLYITSHLLRSHASRHTEVDLTTKNTNPTKSES